jgi:hypothetical protein
MAAEITIRGTEKLRATAHALRQADRQDLLRGMQRAVRRAAKPTLRDVQDAAEHIRTSGVRKPGARRPFVAVMPPKGIRKKIAAAVVADVQLRGDEPLVRFRVSKARLPHNIKDMPRKFDDGTFRHPVMGNRDVWVSQTSDPWFWPPIRDNVKTFRAEIDKAIDETRTKLEAS